MATTEVGIRLSLDGAEQAAAGVRRVTGEMDGLSRAGSAVSDSLRNFASVAAAGISVGAFVKAADAVTVLNNQLKLATGSTQAAGQAFNALFDIAQRSRVSFTELGGTFASISRAGEALGVSQNRLLGVTEAISNAVAVSGGSAESARASLVQLSQGLASGALRGDELNSVMEQTPRLAKALADGLGVSTGELRKLGEQGAITAEKVIKALESQAGVLKGEVANSIVTVGQAFTQLTNASIKAAGDIDKATGVTTTLASAMQGLAGVVSTVGQAFKENETAISVTLGVLGGAATVAGIGLVIARVAALATSVGGLAGAVGLLNAALAANPVTLALLGLGAVVGGGAALYESRANSIEGLGSRIKDLSDRVKEFDDEVIANGGRTTAAVEQRRAALVKLRDELQKKVDVKTQSNVSGIEGNGDQLLERAEKLSFEKRLNAKKAFDLEYASSEEKLTAKIAAEREKLGSLFGPAEEAKIRASFKKAGAGANDAAKDIALFNDTISKGQGYSADYAEKVGTFARLYAKNKISLTELSAAMKVLDADQQINKDSAKEVEDQLKATAKAQEQYLNVQLKAIATAEQSADKAKGELQKYIDEEAALVKVAEKHISLAQAIAEVELARLRENQTKAIQSNANDGVLLALQEEIDKREEIVKAIGRKEARTIADKSAKDAASAWQKASDQIENSLTDALFRGFESGKDLITNLRDTIVNTFKTMVLRPIVSAIVNPIAGAAASALGFSGSAVAGAAGSTAGSSLAGAAGAAGAAAFTSGFSLAMSGAGGVAGASIFSGTALALEGGAAMVASATGLSSAAAGLAQIAGALGPYAIGLVAVAGILGAFKGEYVKGAGSATLGFDTAGSTTSKNQFGNSFDFQTDAADKFVAGLLTSYTKAATSLGIKNAGGAFAFGSNNSDGGKFGVNASVGSANYATTDIKISEDALKLEASRAVFAALQGSELPGYMAKVFDGVVANTASAADIDGALNFAKTLKTVRDALTETREPLQILKDTVAEGFKSLGTSADTFKTDFVAAIDAGISPEKLSDWVSLGNTMDTLTAQVGSLDVAASKYLASLKSTNAQLGVDLLTAQGNTSGARSAQRTLDTAGFTQAEIAQYDFNETLRDGIRIANAATEAQDKLNASIAGLKATGAQLAVDLLVAQDDPGAQAAQRALDTLDFTQAEINLYDYNASLRAQIVAANDAKAALTAFNNTLAGLKSTGTDLSIEILRLQGDDVGANALTRAKDLAVLNKELTDPAQIAATTAAYDYNAGLRAQVTALQAAAQATVAFQNTLSTLGSTNLSLQAQLLTAQGNTSGALALTRSTTLAGLTKGKTPEQVTEITAAFKDNTDLEDTIAATITATNTANAAASAGQAAASAAQSEISRVASERKGLQDQLDNLTLTNVQLLVKQRAALDESNRALFDQVQAATAAAEALKITTSLQEAGKTLAIDLLRAQGNEAAAVAAERAIAIKGYSAEQIAIYDSNQAVKAMVTELNRLKEVSKTLAQELPGVIAKFQSPEGRTATSYRNIAQDLIDAGLTNIDLTSLTATLTGATKETIGQVAAELFNALPDSAVDAKLALTRAAGGLADLKDAAISLATALKEQVNNLIPTVAAKFQTPETRTAVGYRTIAQSLIDAGISNADIDTLTNGLIGASKDTLRDVGLALFKTLPEGADAAKLALLNAGSGLADLKDDAAALAETLRGNVATAFDTAINKFQTPEQRTRTAYTGIAQNLKDAGLTGLDLDTLTNGLIGASKDSIAEITIALYNSLPEGADKAKRALLTAASGLSDLKDSAAELAKTLKDQVAVDLAAVINKFQTPEQRTATSYTTIAQDLITAGITNIDVGTLAKALTGTGTKALTEIGIVVWNSMAGASDTAKIAFLKAASGLYDLADAAEQADKELAKTNASLNDRLAIAAGTKTDEQVSRANELAGATDASTKSILRQIFAQEDLNKITEKAAELAKTNAGLQDRLDLLTGAQTSRSIDLRDATDESSKAILRQIFAQEDLKTATESALATAEKATGAAFSGVQRAIDAQRKIVQSQLQVAQESVGNLNSIFNTLKGGIKSLYDSAESLTAYTTDSAKAFLSTALGTAQTTGYLPDAAQLSDAVASAISGTQGAQYATQADAEFAKLALAGTLGKLKDITGQQLTSAEQAVKLAESQLDTLDATLKSAQDQLDALNGIDTSVKSVADAMRDLSSAISGQTAAKAAAEAVVAVPAVASAGSSYVASLNTAYGAGSSVATGSGYNINTATGSFVLNKSGGVALGIEAGWSPAQVAAQIENNLSAFKRTGETESVAALEEYAKSKGIPGFSQGINYVPQDMTARIHEGEAVVPKDFNPYNPNAQGGANAKLERLVEGLTAEVQRLQAVVALGNQNTRRTADAVNGNPDAPMLVSTV